MKILFPRNIEKWFISWLNFTFWPFKISFVQLILLAIWAAWTLWLTNRLIQSWFNQVVAIVFSLPILVVFMIIAFFNISELWLIPFLCKMIRTHVLDVTKKYQQTFAKISFFDILISKRRNKEKKEEIKKKTNAVNKELLEKMEKWTFV